MNKKFYLTKKGLKKIQEDYERLKKAKQNHLRRRDPASEVLNSGELSPDYIYFQEDLNFLETRITELEYVLKNAEPIKPTKGVIDVGTVVTVDINGKDHQLVIVESLEADPGTGMISKESVVGKALLGGREGDKIMISSPIKTGFG